jgi:hypothetical protein
MVEELHLREKILDDLISKCEAFPRKPTP